MKTPWKIQVKMDHGTQTIISRVIELKKQRADEKLKLEDGSEWPVQNIISINGICF
jgi:hypothetical protein